MQKHNKNDYKVVHVTVRCVSTFYLFIYFLFNLVLQGHCTLIKHSSKCIRISQRLFFIRSPWQLL